MAKLPASENTGIWDTGIFAGGEPGRKRHDRGMRNFHAELAGLQTAFDALGWSEADLSAKLHLARVMRKVAEEQAETLKAQYGTITSMQKAA